MPSTSQHLLIWTPSGAITNKLHIKGFVRWKERRQAAKWAVKNIIYCYLLADVWVYKVNVVIQAGCEHCCAASIFWQWHVCIFFVPLKSRFINFPLGFFTFKEIRDLSTIEALRCIAEKTELKLWNTRRVIHSGIKLPDLSCSIISHTSWSQKQLGVDLKKSSRR